MKQNKNTKKRRQRTLYNQAVLKILSAQYGYSHNYIVKALRGDRVGIMPDILIKEYKKVELSLKEALKNVANNLNQ